MTSSIRSRLPRKTPSRGHRVDPEERFTQRVTLLFVGLIVAVVAIVIIAFAYDWYVKNVRPVATVGGTGITRSRWVDRARLEYQRLVEQEQSTREQISAGTLSPDEGEARISNIEAAQNNVSSTSIENLIDLTFQGQLATAEGLSVTDEDVDAAIAAEATTPEARSISLIAVEPQAADAEATPAESQAAFRAIQDAAAALEAGTAFEEVAKLYSTDESADTGGAYGFVTADSTLDAGFIGTLFQLELGGVTPVIQGDDGVWRIGRVDEIRAGTHDTSYEQSMRDTVGWDLFRSEVRAEALAQRLKDRVLTDATSADVPQVRLAEIVLEADTSLDPIEDEGQIRAAHILYTPNDDPQAAAALDPEDPAWAEAEALAQRAADQLRAVADPELRADAFAMRAKRESDDIGSGANGGDLGFFSRAAMVAEFADPLFDDEALVAGDIVGPVRSDFGWHVIQFQERAPGVQSRIDAVVAALDADGADFAEVARTLSDGAQAPGGGDLGWQAQPQVDDKVWTAVTALEPGAHTEAPVPLDDGYHFYQLIAQETRPLDPRQQALIGETAFADWYDPQKETATADGTISRDQDLFESTPSVGG